MAERVTKHDVEGFAPIWYLRLDIHAPKPDLVEMVHPEKLEMVFPEETLKSLADFEAWYDKVVGIFFDEHHTIKKLDATEKDDGTADVDVLVNWKTRLWTAPAAKSTWLDLDIPQKWTLAPHPKTGRPAITYYYVDAAGIVPQPGSGAL